MTTFPSAAKVWIASKIHVPVRNLASRLSSLNTVRASCSRSWSCMSSSRIGGAVSCPGSAKSHTKLVRHKCSLTSSVSCLRSLSSMGISSHLVVVAGDIVCAVHCLMVFTSPLRGSVTIIPAPPFLMILILPAPAVDQGMKKRAIKVCRCGRSRCDATVDQGVKTRKGVKPQASARRLS